MQKPIFTAVVVAATFLAAGARAETTPSPAPVATPSSPAPVVAASPAVAAAPTAPNQIIYAPRLPSANELTSVAAAQGVTVERIDQTSSQITVTYRFASGQANIVSYQLLPTSTMPAPTRTTVVQAVPPTVVYAPPPRVIYYEEPEPVYYPRYYYPYYPPVSLSFGFGYHRHYGGGFHHRRW